MIIWLLGIIVITQLATFIATFLLFTRTLWWIQTIHDRQYMALYGVMPPGVEIDFDPPISHKDILP